MSSDLYYPADELQPSPENELAALRATVNEEFATLKARVARLVTALQDATDRANRLERQLEAHKEILAMEPVFTVTTEERRRIEALELQQFNMGHARFYHAAGWKTPAFLPKAHVLGIFNKK
jgi:hypothetical protein